VLQAHLRFGLQLSISLQWLFVAGGDVVFFAMATWSLADAISFLRSGYLVAG
jgi:hypothetical protein